MQCYLSIEDYNNARIPMLPITSGIKTTKFNILVYALILFPIATSPYFFNFSGSLYLVIAVVLSSYYIFVSYKLLKQQNSRIEKKLATRLFGYSILYLFLIFTFVLVDKVI